jgi:hypothetical protein
MIKALGGLNRLPVEEAELTDNYAFFAPPAESDKLLAVEFKVEDALRTGDRGSLRHLKFATSTSIRNGSLPG